MRTDRSLRREQELLASVIDTAGILIVVFSASAKVERINHLFAELTGMTLERVNELGWRALIPEEHHATARHAVRNAVGGATTFETTLRAADGGLRQILWSGTMIRSEDGSPDHFVVTGTDLTEVRLLREELDESRRTESLGRVAATLVHEFNNVLMSISPWAEVIARRPERVDGVRRAAEGISRAVKRGGAITDAVVRFARPKEPIVQPIAAAQWTRALVSEMQPVVKERSRGNVALDLTTGTDAWTSADPAQLHQVFSNLILNATDAMPDGGRITLSITCVAAHAQLPAVEADDVRWIHWQIRDSGGGMAPDVLEKIFEPFFTTRKNGTGLGLAVAHQIIKAHGGVISVESAVGRGTTFHIFVHSIDPA